MRDIKFFVSVIESPHNQSVLFTSWVYLGIQKFFSFSFFLLPSQAKRKEGQDANWILLQPSSEKHSELNLPGSFVPVLIDGVQGVWDLPSKLVLQRSF